MKRKTVRIISYITAAFAVIGVFELAALSEGRKYEKSLENIRLPALTALCEYSQAVSVGLRTMAVSADDSLNDSCSFVREQASAALGNMYCFNSESVEGMTVFFETVRDFAQSENIDVDRAIELSDLAEDIYYRVDGIVGNVLESKISLLETDDNFFENKLDIDFKNDELHTASDAVTAVRTNGKRIGKKEAAEKAGELFGIDPVLIRESSDNYTDGADTYNFKYGNITVRICKGDGSVHSFTKVMPCTERKITVDEAQKTAESFVLSQNIPSAVLTGSDASEFTADFEFAPKNGDTVLLTSRITVSVCLSSGDISEYDASEYLKNYDAEKSVRDNKPDIKRRLPEGAYMTEKILCLCNIKGRERYCYRAKCRFRGEYYYLYFDYNTLRNVLTTQA